MKIKLIFATLLCLALVGCAEGNDGNVTGAQTTAAETYKYIPPTIGAVDEYGYIDGGDNDMTQSYTITEHEAGGIKIPEYVIPEEDRDLTTKKNTDVTFPEQNKGETNTNSQFLGANHIWPTFSRTGENTLTDGGLTTLELGSSTIKTYVSHLFKNYYKWDTWPEEGFKDPVDMVSHEYYESLFSMDLDTYVLGVYIFTSEFGGHPAVYWSSRFPEAARKMEYEQLYELTYYLCKKYEGTGKTFIIQNWESDWACLPSSANRGEPSQEIFDRMIRWTNTRQDAVMAARRDADCEGVNVYHSIEVNRNIDGMNGKACVLDNVVPYTYCDFYAYSCYDTQESDETFAASLDKMLEVVASNRTGGASRCFIGEFGWPHQLGDDYAVNIAERVTRIAREKGFSHAFWWELYGNPLTGDGGYTYWLINDKNEYSPVWNVLYKFINGTDSEAYLASLEGSKLQFPLTYAINDDGSETEHGIEFVEVAFDGKTQIIDVGGKKARASVGADAQDYIYFKCDSVVTPDMERLDITVNYFDSAKGTLTIQYNDNAGNVVAVKQITAKGTGEWQTATFKLRNAGFEKRFHGGFADFRLSFNGNGELSISSVEIVPAE